ncbi:hypothetical protein EIP75_00770 [Aquabacterium soli]|uniref:Uncharacterized protein n=1 Tax=Aquabacterium soli TaxID=2493092 RepID=A0A3R8U7C9_9BURK|nr:hypothetical protein [Aquabacterium soli]RRS06166.1 hypothetical protein EIP75_00770 [Aquabacterium soli]
MAAFNPFERSGHWPDALSAAQWLKQGAPVSTRDDGKALAMVLAKLEGLYKKVDVADLQPRRNQVFSTLDELEDAEKGAKAAYRSTVVPLIAQALEARKQALTLAKLCQADPKVPKPVVVLAAQMAKAADEVAEAFKDLGTIFRPFDEARKTLVKADGQLRKTLQPHLTALNKGLDQCQKSPSRELWDKLCKGPCNAVHNTVKNAPRLKDAFWGVWKVHDGDSFSHALQMAEKSAKDDKARQKLEDVIVRMCKELRGELGKLDKAVG